MPAEMAVLRQRIEDARAATRRAYERDADGRFIDPEIEGMDSTYATVLQWIDRPETMYPAGCRIDSA